jgi:hypothetical protein
VDAAGDEKHVKTVVYRAADVSRQPVADGQAFLPAEVGDEPSRGIVDRPVRLADQDRLATDLAVEAGERAGAIDKPVAPLHHQVRIGADHRQAARGEPLELLAIGFRRLRRVVEEARAADQLRLVLAGEDEVEPLVEGHVAVGAEVHELHARPLGDDFPGDVAGGEHRVVGVLRHAEAAKLLADRPGRARGVGDEHHRASLGPKIPQRLYGLRKGGDAVVEHAPDIAKERIVAAAKVLQPGDAPHPISRLCRPRGVASAARPVNEAGWQAAKVRARCKLS